MAIKHRFVDGKADGVDATVVRPSDWNATHDPSNIVTTLAASTAIASGTHETVYGNPAGADITLTLPTAVGITGQRFRFMHIGTGAGHTVIDGAGTETINGALTYTLVNQYQYVELESDGANWFVFANN